MQWLRQGPDDISYYIPSTFSKPFVPSGFSFSLGKQQRILRRDRPNSNSATNLHIDVVLTTCILSLPLLFAIFSLHLVDYDPALWSSSATLFHAHSFLEFIHCHSFNRIHLFIKSKRAESGFQHHCECSVHVKVIEYKVDSHK